MCGALVKEIIGSQSLPNSKKQRRWTTHEITYLRQHRSEGSELIANALMRSVPSVQHMASRLGISLGNVGPGDTCPICQTYTIALNSAAAKHGMCVCCYERRKADIRRQAEAEKRCKQLYEKEKKRAQRRSRDAD